MSEPQSAPAFRVRYQLTLGDLLRFRCLHRLRSPFFVGFVALWLVLASIAFFLLAFTEGDMGSRILWVIVADCFALAGFLSLCLVGAILDLVSRRNRMLFAENVLTLDESGLTAESQYAKSEMKWPIVQRLVRTRYSVLFYVTSRSAFVVPRRAFRDDAEYDAFCEYCRQRMRPA